MIPYDTISDINQVQIIKANPGYQKLCAWKNKNNEIKFFYEDIIAWYIEIVLRSKTDIVEKYIKPIGIMHDCVHEEREELIPIKTPDGCICYDDDVYEDLQSFSEAYDIDDQHIWHEKR